MMIVFYSIWEKKGEVGGGFLTKTMHPSPTISLSVHVSNGIPCMYKHTTISNLVFMFSSYLNLVTGVFKRKEGSKKRFS